MSDRSSVKLTYTPVPVAPVPKVLGTAVPKSVDDVAEALTKKLGAGVVKGVEKSHKGDPFVVVETAKIADVLRFLRDDERFYLTSLLCISAADYVAQPPSAEGTPTPVADPGAADSKGHMTVVYNLFSYAHRFYMTIKVRIERDQATVPSVVEVYRAANWYERECYDMFGMNFSNHPNLQRLLLPADWVGHPLRKDYVFPEEYNGMKVPL
ncbi:MAG: NADH-quinone oxidoreductase subunit C [Bdellovibrionales bacterium]|nr:NADH-quinone oxidoreductase subunit C [Bdellovibrionales bacterium]